MIVVDTNIIGYLFLTSDRSSRAEKALLKDPYWVAPLLWRSEFRNVLAQYIRKNILTLKDAKEIMQDASILMNGKEFEVASYQVLNLVNSSSLSAYDCEFIALAKDLELDLVTVDKKILNQFPDCTISLDIYAETGNFE